MARAIPKSVDALKSWLTEMAMLNSDCKCAMSSISFSELPHDLRDWVAAGGQLWSFSDPDAPEAPASPRDHPLFRALEEILGVRAQVVPTFISGTTDSRFFRQRGIPAYGFSPFAINVQDSRGIHADNESVPVDAFLRGVETMTRILRLYVTP